ncbi:amidase [Pararhizobium sp.]|uniref:amidase n=1 Tax=Pararhizobium sp. TaxID=1977563 RepID=UPI00271EA89C|nr:amidase [Pararhizobium sp.]MDO9415251.1 amidase [Pararhizobium sp.]
MIADDHNAFADHAPRLKAVVEGAATGPLHNLTIAVKDIYPVEGWRIGAGNPSYLAESVLAAETFPPLRTLLAAGGRIIGLTRCDELCFSLTGVNRHYPIPINPAAPDRIPGGSSSGSAVAVAAGLADIAIGSDTAGSVRGPAAFNGLIGLRTTHGAIPMTGAYPLASSMDTFGWFAASLDIYERVAACLLPASGEQLCRPLRIAALDACLDGKAERSEYARMTAVIETALGTATPASLPLDLADAVTCMRVLQAEEAWSMHGAWIEAKDRHLAPDIRARFDFGRDLDPAEVQRQAGIRTRFTAAVIELLGNDGFILMPTTPGPAPHLAASDDDLQTFRLSALRLHCISSLTGLPQITLPLGSVDGAPFGISLLGPRASDRALIALATRILSSVPKTASL